MVVEEGQVSMRLGNRSGLFIYLGRYDWWKRKESSSYLHMARGERAWPRKELMKPTYTAEGRQPTGGNITIKRKDSMAFRELTITP